MKYYRKHLLFAFLMYIVQVINISSLPELKYNRFVSSRISFDIFVTSLVLSVKNKSCNVIYTFPFNYLFPRREYTNIRVK